MFHKKLRVEAYEFGSFRLDLVVRQLFYKDKPLSLSSRTFDILKILVEHRGQVVTKEELIQMVWLGRFVEENNLTVRISALRKTLGETVEKRFIETVPGHGYRFVARVGEVFTKGRELQEDVIGSLAVLPLSNENNQQRLNYLCDGITESLIYSLSHIANLKVMARGTVFRYKGRDNDPHKVGKELGVRAVLVGKVTQVNNSLIFNLEMIDVKDGVHLWGAKYKRQASDIITLLEDLPKEISENLQIKLNKVEERQITKRYTDKPQAYHLYMKGRYFWNKRSVQGIRQAIKYFKRAISHDPVYSLAFAGLADSYIVLSSYGLRPPAETMPKAKTFALKALEIDNQLAEAHVSLGNIKSSFELDWPGAEDEFQRAVELNPYYAVGRQYYANYLVKVIRFDQALAEINKAYEIDPLSLSVNLAMGKIYHFARRYEDAVKKGREILEVEPRFGPANGLIGLTYMEMNRYQDAIREFKAMIEFSAGDYKVTHVKEGSSGAKLNLPDSDPEAVALLGYAYALDGKRAKALQLLNELQKVLKKRYVQPHTIALVHMGLGDKDKAFEWLERAFSDKSSTLTYIKAAPFFDSLRTDPRYEELVRRIGLST